MKFFSALFLFIILIGCTQMPIAASTEVPGRQVYLSDVHHITHSLNCDPSRCNNAGVLYTMADVAALHDGVLFCRALRDGKSIDGAYYSFRDHFLTKAQLTKYAIPDLCPNA